MNRQEMIDQAVRNVGEGRQHLRVVLAPHADVPGYRQEDCFFCQTTIKAIRDEFNRLQAQGADNAVMIINLRSLGQGIRRVEV